MLWLCVEASRSAPVIQPRVSRTVWQTSSAAPEGWATTTSSRLTWAPKRSAAGGEALGMKTLLRVCLCCERLADILLLFQLRARELNNYSYSDLSLSPKRCDVIPYVRLKYREIYRFLYEINQIHEDIECLFSISVRTE